MGEEKVAELLYIEPELGKNSYMRSVILLQLHDGQNWAFCCYNGVKGISEASPSNAVPKNISSHEAVVSVPCATSLRCWAPGQCYFSSSLDGRVQGCQIILLWHKYDFVPWSIATSFGRRPLLSSHLLSKCSAWRYDHLDIEEQNSYLLHSNWSISCQLSTLKIKQNSIWRITSTVSEPQFPLSKTSSSLNIA